MAKHPPRPGGFTLVELLVVIALIAMLLGILVPSVYRAKTVATIVRVHAELRGVTLALDMYRQEGEQELPPTRFSCSSRTAYELPIELAPYLPRGQSNGVDVVRVADPFRPDDGYRYRAVGAAIVNESTVLPNAATLWVPDGFPSAEESTGRYCDDPSTSPVRYAVYSLGPDADCGKFDIPGRLPLPGKYWLRDASDTGVIVHFEDARRQVHTSP